MRSPTRHVIPGDLCSAIRQRPTALVSLLCLLALANPAGAQDEPSTVLTVGDRTVAVFEQGEHLLVVPAPLAARLVRDSLVGLPSCDFLHSQLRAWERRVNECLDGTASASRCDSLRRLIGTMRTYEEDFVRPRLTQGWSVVLDSPALEDELLAQVARQLRVDRGRVVGGSALEPSGVPGQMVTLVDADAESWVHRLSGLVDINDPPVVFSATARAFVTRDHLVACALLEGEAALAWNRPVRVTATLEGAAPPPLREPELWALYQHLSQAESATEGGVLEGALGRALDVGVAIGVGLTELDLGGGDRAEEVAYILERLYDDELELVPGLREADFSAAESSSLEITFDASWTGSVETTP